MIFSPKTIRLLVSLLPKSTGRNLRGKMLVWALFGTGGVLVLTSGIILLIHSLGPIAGIFSSGVILIALGLAIPEFYRVRNRLRQKSQPNTGDTIARYLNQDPQTTMLLALSAGFLIAEVLKHNQKN